MASRSSCIHASSLAPRTAVVCSTVIAISSWTLTTGSVTAGATLLLSSAHTHSMSCLVVGLEIIAHLPLRPCAVSAPA